MRSPFPAMLRLLAPCLVLCGCAAGSGVVPVGPDTYFVSALRAPAAGGGRAAYGAVLAEAESFCRLQNRHALTLAIRPDGDPFTPFYPTAFDDTFRCTQSAPAWPAASATAPPG